MSLTVEVSIIRRIASPVVHPNHAANKHVMCRILGKHFLSVEEHEPLELVANIAEDLLP